MNDIDYMPALPSRRDHVAEVAIETLGTMFRAHGFYASISLLAIDVYQGSNFVARYRIRKIEAEGSIAIRFKYGPIGFYLDRVST